MMNEKKYEIVWFENKLGDKDNTICTLEKLKNITLELAQENEFELVNGEVWIQYIEHGKLIENGYEFKSFKDNLSNLTIEVLCGEILNCLDIQIYHVFNKYKTKIEYVSVFPGSIEDNDQVLYQIGYAGAYVSKVNIYIDNKFVAYYGSKVCGEQDALCYFDTNENFVEIGEGEEYRVHQEPKTLIKLQKMEKETGKEYLYYRDSCWLEGYIRDAHGNTLKDNENKCSELECFVHDSISDAMNFIDIDSKDFIDEIGNLVA